MSDRVEEVKCSEGFIDIRLLNEPVVTLEEYGLPLRIINLLEECLGVVYLKDFLKYSPVDVEGVKGIGVESIKSFRTALQELIEDRFRK